MHCRFFLLPSESKPKLTAFRVAGTIFDISEGLLEMYELENLSRKLVKFLQRATKMHDFSLKITVGKNFYHQGQNMWHHLPPPPGHYGETPSADVSMGIVKTLAEPFKALRGIEKTRLHKIMTEEKHSHRKPPRPQPIMRSITLDCEYHPNNSFLYHIPRAVGCDTILDRSNYDYRKYKTEWEAALRVKESGPIPEETIIEKAFDAFAVFHAECLKILLAPDQYKALVEAMFAARVARAKGELEVLVTIQDDVAKRWKKYLKEEKLKWKAGKDALQKMTWSQEEE
jgi:hypothetical protein